MPVFTPQPAYGPPRTNDPSNFPGAADGWVAWQAAFGADMEAFAANLIVGYAATSTTSLSVSVATKNLTVATGLAFYAGQQVIIARTSAPSTTRMVGIVTSYNSGTGALVVAVLSVLGSGTFTDWSISLAPAGVVSAFVSTLLDDADASTFLTTLGVSTFIKTLLDDASLSAANATLGRYAGTVASAGTAVSLPSGWTSSRNSTGDYDVTHNLALNVNDYVVSATSETLGVAFRRAVKSTNKFTLEFGSHSNLATAADCNFGFTLHRVS